MCACPVETTSPPLWFTVLLPLLSVLLGAGITYVLGIRSRRATKREDAFHDAIAATAEAQAAKEWVNQVDIVGATPAELEALSVRLNTEGWERAIAAITGARIALARACAYDPDLQAHLDVPAHRFIEDAAAPAIDRLRRNLGQK